MFATDSLTTLIDSENFIPLVVIGGGLIVAMIYIVFSNVTALFQTRAREETKRELAAYVAEGSMSPDKAIALLTAGEDTDEVAKSIKAIVTAFEA